MARRWSSSPGANGWVCGAGHCLPNEHLALYNACVIDKDFNKGRQIMSALLPLMRLLEKDGKFVQSIKFGCELAGRQAGPVRRSMRGLDDAQKREPETTIRTCI
jgi:4-hydroxy-tetrahydrodipicolinate synthase